MLKVSSVLSDTPSHAVAAATGWQLCQWCSGQIDAILQSVVLSDGRRHGRLALAKCPRLRSQPDWRPGCSVASTVDRGSRVGCLSWKQCTATVLRARWAPGRYLVEVPWTPNEWLAEVVVETACLGNTNHLSWRRDQWRSGQYVQVVTRQQKPLTTWKMLNDYTKAGRLAVVSFGSWLWHRDDYFDDSLVEQQWTVFHQWRHEWNRVFRISPEQPLRTNETFVIMGLRQILSSFLLEALKLQIVAHDAVDRRLCNASFSCDLAHSSVRFWRIFLT